MSYLHQQYYKERAEGADYLEAAKLETKKPRAFVRFMFYYYSS